MCTGIEPCEATAECLYEELLTAEELLVHTRDLQLATGRGPYALGDLDDGVRVEVQPHDSVVALRLLGLLLDRDTAAVGSELRYAVALRVADPVAEDGSFIALLGILDSLTQGLREGHAVEDIVAEYEAYRVAADEVLADEEGLCQPLGARLLCIGEVHAVVATIAEEATEGG